MNDRAVDSDQPAVPRQTGGVVLLIGEGPTGRIVGRALRREFGEIAVIQEDPPSRARMLRRRLARLGPMTVAGQVLFHAIARPILDRAGARRIDAIRRAYGLDDSPIGNGLLRVESADSDEARALLRRLAPAVVVVVGTRLLSAATLACVEAPFINMHGGITPLYRGIHGGYWAVADGRPDLAGTTVHRIDHGIDTGPVLGQATFEVTRQDGFATYPYLHAAAGLPILLDEVRRALAGDASPGLRNPLGLSSRLRSHPTLWGYMARRIARGVR